MHGSYGSVPIHMALSSFLNKPETCADTVTKRLLLVLFWQKKKKIL